MPADLTTTPLLIAAVAFGLLGAALTVAGIAALWRARPLGFALRSLLALLLLALGALAGAIALGMQGFRALTYEQLAAHVAVRPTGAQRFTATVRFPDGRELTYDIAGDEIYIDAHILKWKPLANLLGLHTVYELDRLAGRYRTLDDERGASRTVYSLAPVRLVDLFGLRQRHAFLAPLFDAEYGSATFAPVVRPIEFELLVSTSGLLLREAKPHSR